MDISIKKTCICCILLLSLILTGCFRVTKNDADEIVIKVGNFTVDRQQFESQVKKLSAIQDEWTQEEVTLFLLDNYISAGLLLEAARKLNYEQHKDFINKDSIHQEELVIKYSKQLRANKSKPQHRIKEDIVKMILENEIRIDYIRIPKKEKELAQPLLLYFTHGTNIHNILEDPEAASWENKGLSFYQDISLKHTIIPEKVIEEIMTMQEKEVKIIKTNAAYHLVRFVKSERSPKVGIEDMESELVFQNLLRAQCLEKGDMIFDPYRLKKAIKCNEELLSKIDFSIEAFHTDSGFIAKIGERFVSENEIKEKIAELPVKIQALFVNKSTRVRALATLILLPNNQKPEKVSDWLQPHRIYGYNQLKLDFEKIEKMGMIQNSSLDNEVLAYSDNWSMTVKDFKEELDKLTPITRLDIANKNLLHEMIEYLAKRDYVPNSKLVINASLFESIDIMGKSYDQLNYVFDENTIVGTVGKVDLSVKELRELLTRFSELEKNKFMNLSTRRESFNEIITKKLWLNLYDRTTIEDIPGLKKESSNFQNKLLAKLLYEDKLQANEDKLLSYIQTVMQDYPIQVNTNFFQRKLNFDIGNSKYYKVIIKNIN